MDTKKINRFFSVTENSIIYRVKISFALLFFIPIIGFLHFGIRYDFLGREEAIYYYLAIVVFSLFGFTLLRQIVSEVKTIADNMANDVALVIGEKAEAAGNELEEIVSSFRALNERLEHTGAALDRRVAEIQAIRDLNQLSFGLIDQQALIDRSLEVAIEVTEGTGGAIFSLEKRGLTPFLVCRSVTGEGLRITPGQTIPLSKHPARDALETTRPMLIDRPDDSDWGELFSEDIGQIAAVPLTKSKGYSGIAVMSRQVDKPYPGDILGFLTTFFSTVCTAIKLQEVVLLEREKAEELKTVLYLIKMINSGLSENEMLLAIADKLNEVIPHHWIGLALLEDGSEELKLAHTFHKSSSDVPLGLVFPSNYSVFQTAMRSKSVISLENIEQAPRNFEQSFMKTLDMKSCLLAGLSFKGRPVGTICLAHTSKGAFHKKHGRILSMIAEEMSITIEQARLLDKSKVKTGELELLNRVGIALTSSTFNMERVLTYTI
ncbi:MAG: GAF domain-containing protein, partial [Gemmatimonadota bacterium]|nr:GAF domain-containing protein [Gemmatimonadota bacterium]